MNIAVIGGGGVRTPLLVNGLTQSDLPIREIALYDVDQERLAAITAVARHYAQHVSLRACASSAEAITGADYVFTSIRVGGIEQRARDEATSLAHGVLGQETIGPAGFAMAARTIPHLVRYAQEVETLAPNAWMINFTNPVGIVTQAAQTASRAKIIGICDTPTELFEEVAHALGVPSAECHFDYFGLNHLGWLREVYHRGRPQLRRLWGDRELLQKIYRAPLFDPEYLTELRLLPTEYVYYYLRPRHALENMMRAGETRGEVIRSLNEELFRDLARPGVDAVRVYERYLATRSATYMQIEAGALIGGADPSGPPGGSPRQRAGKRVGDPGDRPAPPNRTNAVTGYDKIALAVLRGIHFNSGAIIPLDVRNDGNLALAPEDVVEVPCVVNANGALPMHVATPPRRVAEFIARVKNYERLTIAAAIQQTAQAAVEALASNPLVGDRAVAHKLYDALAPIW